MITKTINLYTFDELTPEAKEKAREWYREGNNDSPFLEDYMNEKLLELLEENKITDGENLAVLYSLGYSQGDGAMFGGTFNFKGHSVTVEHRTHYYYCNSKQITWNDFVEEEKEIAKEFEETYKDICKKLEKYGYDYIEYEDSEEVVDENIRINEYTFTIDGIRQD